MKKILLFLCAIFANTVSADNAIEIDGIYYNLIEKAQIAEVTKNPNNYSGIINIPESVTYDGVKYTVTSIGAEAFSASLKLSSVSIPPSVTMIDERAFYQCIHLTSVIIPDGVTIINASLFEQCYNLASVTIPESVSAIGDRAFNRCENLASITIPQNVTIIGSDAFVGCKLHNILIKCTKPPGMKGYSNNFPFTEMIFYHTTLYVPTDCWDTYAYDDKWYKFSNIREIASLENQVSDQLVYTLMDARSFEYSIYDPTTVPLKWTNRSLK